MQMPHLAAIPAERGEANINRNLALPASRAWPALIDDIKTCAARAVHGLYETREGLTLNSSHHVISSTMAGRRGMKGDWHLSTCGKIIDIAASAASPARRRHFPDLLSGLNRGSQLACCVAA